MPEAQPGNPDIGNDGERMVAGSGGWSYDAHLSLYARAAGVVKGKGVLEGGCGTGYGSFPSYEPRSLIACDGSAEAVAYCRRNYPGVVAAAGRRPAVGGSVSAAQCVMERYGEVEEHLAVIGR